MLINIYLPALYIYIISVYSDVKAKAVNHSVSYIKLCRDNY